MRTRQTRTHRPTHAHKHRQSVDTHIHSDTRGLDNDCIIATPINALGSVCMFMGTLHNYIDRFKYLAKTPIEAPTVNSVEAS